MQRELLMIHSNKLNFIFYSALKTIFTFIVYQVAIFYFNYIISYLLSWVFGLVFGYISSTKKVFKRKINIYSAIYYFFWNILYVCISIFIIGLFINQLGIHERIAPIIFLLIILPINYLITKKIVNL